MFITIKPSHLRGNSWSHQANPESRRCPLEEAVREQFPGKKVWVSAEDLTIDGKKYEFSYQIWNETSAEDAIEKANKGSEEGFTLEITENNNYDTYV